MQVEGRVGSSLERIQQLPIASCFNPQLGELMAPKVPVHVPLHHASGRCISPPPASSTSVAIRQEYAERRPVSGLAASPVSSCGRVALEEPGLEKNKEGREKAMNALCLKRGCPPFAGKLK